MAIKKSELYSSLWASCDELRGGMDASQYKDYVLVMLFIKYVSDKYAGVLYAPINIPKGTGFKDMAALKGTLRLKYLKAWISYEGLQRVETYPVPEAALREAILNAVVHKEYASAIPVQISVYADKMMIWNPGQLPAAWTIARLLGKHPSEPFNPNIANAFFRARLIESWGRGVERIMQACDAAGVPAPEFRQEAGGMWTIFGFAQQPDTTLITTQETTPITTQEAPPPLGKALPQSLPRSLPQSTVWMACWDCSGRTPASRKLNWPKRWACSAMASSTT